MLTIAKVFAFANPIIVIN